MKFIYACIVLFTVCSCTTNKKGHPSYNKVLDGYDYPYPTKRFHFESQKQDLHMNYMNLNPDGKKTYVLLHGKNFGGYYWKKVADLLIKQNYNVIIPDQIGFGKSSKPQTYQFSFYQLANNTRRLLDHLEVKTYTLVGHSMGGMLATHMTYNFPNAVERLVLINPIGLEPYLKYVEYKDPQFFYKNEISKTPENMRSYQKKNYYDGRWSQDYEKLLTPHIGQMNHPDWPKVAWNNALTYGPIFTEDITRLMSEIETPTHLIVGTRDRTGPGRKWKKPGVTKQLGLYKQLATITAKRFKNARLYELKGLGHMPHFEDFSLFKKAFHEAIKN